MEYKEICRLNVAIICKVGKENGLKLQLKKLSGFPSFDK